MQKNSSDDDHQTHTQKPTLCHHFAAMQVYSGWSGGIQVEVVDVDAKEFSIGHWNHTV